MAAGNKHRAAKLRMQGARDIMNRLKRTALHVDPNDPDKPMTAAQVRAGELYLKKSIPDLRSVEVLGKIDNNITVCIKIV